VLEYFDQILLHIVYISLIASLPYVSLLVQVIFAYLSEEPGSQMEAGAVVSVYIVSVLMRC